MKSRPFSHIFSALLFFTIPGLLAAPKSLPVHPKEALTLLPMTPSGLEAMAPWEMIISRGRQQINVDWVTTTFERSFRQKQPKEGEEAATVSLRVVDTGGYEVLLQMFGVNPISEPRSDREVQGYPAIDRRVADGRRLVILVAGRWLVDVQTTGLADPDFLKFLEALPLEKLTAVKDVPMQALPKQLTLLHVDELNEAGNSKRREFFLTQAEKVKAAAGYSEFLEQAEDEDYGSGMPEEPKPSNQF